MALLALKEPCLPLGPQVQAYNVHGPDYITSDNRNKMGVKLAFLRSSLFCASVHTAIEYERLAKILPVSPFCLFG